MKQKNTIWAFIPARSGSKGLKNKNIIKLNGHPLLAYSIRIAQKIETISKIILSTDSKKYIKIGKMYGCKDFHLRSKKISGDKTSEYEVFIDFIKYRIKKNLSLPKYFLHLRPTTPIRKKETVEKVIKFFLKNYKNCSSLRTVTEMSNPSYRSNKILNGKLCAINKKDFNLDKYFKARQFFPKTYWCNAIVDIYKTKNIMKGFLFGNQVIPYITSDFFNDIDHKNDLEFIKFYLKKNRYKI